MKKIIMMSLLLCSTTVAAQYVGPGNMVKSDLGLILAKPTDDEHVRLQGYLIKKVSSDKYLFSDGKNQIRVEIEQEAFPAEPFDEKALVEIEGEVEKDFMESPEIDVKRLSIVRQ